MSNASGKSMDAIEEKIRMKEARGEALTEMAQEGKFKDTEKQMDVDFELAALKAQMESNTPKLIVEEVDPDKKKD
jgi:phage shock protein A